MSLDKVNMILFVIMFFFLVITGIRTSNLENVNLGLIKVQNEIIKIINIQTDTDNKIIETLRKMQ